MKWNGCIYLQANLLDILFWNHLALLFSSVAKKTWSFSSIYNNARFAVRCSF